MAKPFDDLVARTTTNHVRAAAEKRAEHLLKNIFSSRAIRNDRELDEAIKMVDALIARRRLSAAESDYLEVLEMLVSKYENEHHRPARCQIMKSSPT